MKYFSIFLLAVLNFKPAFSNLDIPIDKKTIVRLFESGTPITDKNIHKIRTGTIFECKRIHYKRFAIYGHFYPYYYYKFLNTDIGFIVMSKEVLWNPSKRLNTDFFLKKILSEGCH